eukprot:5105211-Alexandrium_andersonii.AAC.1
MSASLVGSEMCIRDSCVYCAVCCVALCRAVVRCEATCEAIPALHDSAVWRLAIPRAATRWAVLCPAMQRSLVMPSSVQASSALTRGRRLPSKQSVQLNQISEQPHQGGGSSPWQTRVWLLCRARDASRGGGGSGGLEPPS